MTNTFFFLHPELRSYLILSLMSVLLIGPLLGCAQTLRSEFTTHAKDSAALTDVPHTSDLSFKEDMAALIADAELMNDDIDHQNISQPGQFNITKSFTAASGERCCIVQHKSLDRKALYCKKDEGGIIRVRLFE